MGTLNPRYITSNSLMDLLVDKDSGAPLADGYIEFYRAADQITLKSVYEIVSTSTPPPDYSYSPLPNPLVLNGVGTPINSSGEEINIYYLPYLNSESSEPDLYYIKVYNSSAVLQFERFGFPNLDAGSDGGQSGRVNYIPNGQFLGNIDVGNDNQLTSNEAFVAYGPWFFKQMIAQPLMFLYHLDD